MKITLETAETIHKAMAYTVMICSYETTKKIPCIFDFLSYFLALAVEFHGSPPIISNYTYILALVVAV